MVRGIRTDVSSRIRDCRVSPSFLVFALVKLPRQLASDTDEKRRKKKTERKNVIVGDSAIKELPREAFRHSDATMHRCSLLRTLQGTRSDNEIKRNIAIIAREISSWVNTEFALRLLKVSWLMTRHRRRCGS